MRISYALSARREWKILHTPDKKLSPDRHIRLPRTDRASACLIYNPGFPIVERTTWNSD